MRKYSRFNLYLDEEDKRMLRAIARHEQEQRGDLAAVSPSSLVKQWIRDKYARLFGEDAADTDAAPDDALAA
jgi:hypothetical protein